MIRAFFFLLLTCAVSTPLHAKLPQELKVEPFNFRFPPIEKRTLSNGMAVFLLEDPELPLIQITAYIRTGSMFEPETRVGTAMLCGALLRAGGTKFRQVERIDEELEFLGASVDTGIDLEMGSASLSILKKDFDTGLKTFAEILIFPAFDKKKLEIEKAKLIESIRRRNDEPFQIARRELRALIYGSRHPLSRTPEIPTIKKSSRKDLVEFYQRYYHPNNVYLAVSGSFETEAMAKKLEAAFGKWEKKTALYPTVAALSERDLPSEKSGAEKRIVGYAEKNLKQASILLAHLGIKRHHPDRFALEVMNEILGGGSFTSQLYKEVRSRSGLAYWVGSSFSEPFDYGLMAAGCQTKSESAGRAIQSILKVMEELRQNGVRDVELTMAKEAIINSFVFRFDTSHAIVTQKMWLEYFNFPPDYFETYTQKIASVSASDILEAAKKYLHPRAMSLLIVGNQKDFDVPLKEFGEVRKIDLKIPE